MPDQLYKQIVDAITEDPPIKEALTQDEIAALRKLLLNKKLPSKEALLASLYNADINED